MFKYVALAWNTESAEQSRTAHTFGQRMSADGSGWELAHSAEGLRIYCAGARHGSVDINRLTDGAGIVLGTVFHRVDRSRDDPPSKAVFGRRETRRILMTQGRSLVEDYWGRYVAFIVDARERAVTVLRSPTGELDCLTACMRGVNLFFSRAEDCPLLPARDSSVNWSFLAALLAASLPETRQTGLNEVERLLHGESVTLQAGVTKRRRCWSPLEFINSPARIEDPFVASCELRHTARACVSAWASCHDNMLAMLSGGFDSSVVVSLLPGMTLPPQVTCINYRNEHDPTTDERRYAALVARHKGYRLVEHENSDEIALEHLLGLNRRPLSCQPVLAFPDPGWRRDLARSLGATACITGEGGDQLFFQNGAYYVCADFIHVHGCRPRALSIALDAARIEGGAMWRALRIGVRDARRDDPVTAVTDNYRFSALVAPDARRAVQEQRMYVPEFLRQGERAPPGKCWQSIGLSVHDEMYGAHAEQEDTEFLYPLMSQPLQELCFRIPTWVLTIGGQSRGLARRAFAADAPGGVLNRRTKAFGYDSLKELVARNRPTLRSLLLDGMLVARQIIDRQNLERLLSGDVAKGIGNASDVIAAVLSEIWLQRWAELRDRNIAA
jgi:asparagine synthase (glutamine-hydrolysing)